MFAAWNNDASPASQMDESADCNLVEGSAPSKAGSGYRSGSRPPLRSVFAWLAIQPWLAPIDLLFLFERKRPLHDFRNELLGNARVTVALTAYNNEESIGEAVANGFEIVELRPQFLPLTIKSRLPVWPFLIRAYLALPIKPLGKQMLVVARVRRSAI